MSECIHGLEIPLCDSCYPKAVPERPRAARAPSAPRTPRASVTTFRKPVTASPMKAAEQRVYHITHIRNLEGILAAGELSADATPAVDVSSELTRELRMSAPLRHGAGGSGGSVAEHVPFYLTPDAALWGDLRAGALDETRWSDAARKAMPHEFVFLVSTIAALGSEVVIADGDAAAAFTGFASGDGIQRALERLRDDEDAGRGAEALAPQRVPFAAVHLIGVANDRVRDRVRELLGATVPKVAVYPPWFQSS